MFSWAFSSGFAHAGYICPMCAQAALAEGAVPVIDGSALRIGGDLLIGQAGKVYEFSSCGAADVWARNAAAAAMREAQIIAAMSDEARAVWVEKKRQKLRVIAARVASNAAKQNDEKKRAALIAESDYCLNKWS